MLTNLGDSISQHLITRPGKRLQFKQTWSHGPVESVDLLINSMVISHISQYDVGMTPQWTQGDLSRFEKIQSRLAVAFDLFFFFFLSIQNNINAIDNIDDEYTIYI